MKVLKILRFVAGFGLARALLVLAPIALANLLPLDKYGQFELVHSWAAVGSVLLGFGLAATVPLIRLRENTKGRWDSLLLLVSLLAAGCLLLALGGAAWIGTLYAIPVLVPLAMAVLILQGVWAATLKSDGRSTSAVFVEAGFWTVAVAGAALIGFSGNRLSLDTISAALLAYAVLLITVTVVQFTRSCTGAIAMIDFRRNLTLGLPLMVTGILTVIISSSGRLVLGQTSGAETVALYAILYRAAVIAMVPHQFLIIALFRQLYMWSDKALERLASVIVLGVTGTVLAFWLLEPTLGFLLGERFNEVFGHYRTEGLILLIQLIIVSAISLNDLVNSRLQIAGKVAKVSLPVLALGLGALWLWTHMLAIKADMEVLLYGFVLGYFVLITAYYVTQCWVSTLLGHRFLRLWLTVAVCTAGTSGLIFLGEYIR